MRRWAPAVVLVLAGLVLAPATPAGGATTIEWIKQFGSTKYDEVWGVAADASGIYVTGYTSGAFPGQDALGKRDIFLAKYDVGGNELWTRQFGTPKDDTAFMVATDGIGGIYITGNTGGRFAGQAKHGGGMDGYVAKFDPEGTMVWIRQFGTPDGDFSSNVTASDAGVFVVGSTFGSFPGTRNRGEEDVFVLRFDPDGELVWARQFGTPKDDIGFADAVDATGVYVDGFTPGRVVGQPRHGALDAVVRKYDFDGSALWTSQFGTSGVDVALGLAAEGSALYVVGQTDGEFPGESLRGATDAFVRKIDSSDGAAVWTRQLGSKAADLATSVTIDATGVHVIGLTRGMLGSGPANGKYDIFAGSLDAAGTTSGTFRFGTTRVDYGNWSTASDGAVFVVGATKGTWPGQSSVGGGDAYLARVDVG